MTNDKAARIEGEIYMEDVMGPGMHIIQPTIDKDKMFEKLSRNKRLIVILKLAGFSYTEIKKYYPACAIITMKRLIKSTREIYPELDKWL